MDFLGAFNSNNISLAEAILRVVAAGVSGFVISSIYKLYHGRGNYKLEMIHSLIFLSLIICIAMMIVGNNLASAFGLVGAVSIIRFRTSVKSTRDMSFVFFTIVIGMSCGLGYLSLAATGFIITIIFMLIIFLFNEFNKRSSDFTFKISIKDENFSSTFVESILSEYCSNFRLENIKCSNKITSVQYRIMLEKNRSLDSFLNLFLDRHKNIIDKISISKVD